VNKIWKNSIWIFSVHLLISCSNVAATSEDYYTYLEDEDNGVTRTKIISDIRIKTKFLPPEYLCYQELKVSENFVDRDSVLENYKYNVTFLVSIGPSENAEEEFDVTKVGISNYDEFKERAMIMTFYMGEFFQLKTDNGTYTPVFCEMENVYGLTYDRKFNIVFTPQNKKDELISSESMTLVYNDELFNTGLSRYKFNKEDLDEIPEIGFW